MYFFDAFFGAKISEESLLEKFPEGSEINFLGPKLEISQNGKTLAKFKSDGSCFLQLGKHFPATKNLSLKNLEIAKVETGLNIYKTSKLGFLKVGGVDYLNSQNYENFTPEDLRRIHSFYFYGKNIYFLIKTTGDDAIFKLKKNSDGKFVTKVVKEKIFWDKIINEKKLDNVK